MQLCYYGVGIGKNRRCALCCRRPGKDKPTGHSPSSTFRQCAMGSDRKDYASTSAVVFLFQMHNAEPNGKSWSDQR